MSNRFLIYIILFLFSVHLNSQTIYPKNFQILDSLINIETKRIALEIKNKNIEKIEITFSEHPASWLVKQHFYKALSDSKIQIETDKATETVKFNLNIKQVEIQYLPDANERDSLFRCAVVSLDGNISNNNNIEIIENNLLTYKDKISRDDIEQIKSDYTFANAPVPEKQKTFFEEIAVPFVVVTTAILTVVILFTVRSG
ncbi:MAG: hypothetical protein V1779_12985 [bacterium]